MALAIVVDRKRFGLANHAICMSKFCSMNNIDHQVFIPENLINTGKNRFVEDFKIHKLFSKKYKKIVIWSFGICVLLIPLLRIFGKKIIFVQHEPGGLSQRIKKKDALHHALLVSILEIIFVRYANIIGTPNKKNANKFKLEYTPLLFPNQIDNCVLRKKKIVYLGRKDSRRNYELFLSNEFRRNLSDYSLEQFPDGDSSSEEDKSKILHDASAVFNVYNCQHNQSGVTGDALSHGVRVIISKYDAWYEDLRSSNAAIIVKPELTPSEMALEILKNLQKAEINASTEAIYEENFGMLAFNNFWKRHVL
jgi:glycosyltransferase involved in cell wall biosynthesis